MTTTSNSPSTSQELAVIDATVVAVRRPPTEVLAEAHEAARAIQSIVAAKPRGVTLNGERYLEFEDWQTVGRFYGVTPKVVDVRYVEYGNVCGFTADAVAIRSDGMEISRASADCLNDEEKWRAKPKYERELQMTDGTWVAEPVDETKYPKSVWKWHDNPRRPESRRRQVGEEKVPLFQLKSMAQTRACAKVLRNVLAWVVVLAGYRPTPAEELEQVPDVQHQNGPTKPSETTQSAGASGAAPAPPATSQAAPNAGNAPSPAKPGAPLPPGVTTIVSITEKKGAGKNGPWTRRVVKFADGREAVTFSDTLAATLAEALAGKLPVNPDIVKTEKGSDLKGLLPVPVVEPEHVDEPVSGPEKVLIVRKIETDHGPRYVIQTDKRQLVSDQEKHANDAIAARDAKLGIVPEFQVMKGASGSVNRLTSFVVESPVEEREPGQEG